MRRPRDLTKREREMLARLVLDDGMWVVGRPGNRDEADRSLLRRMLRKGLIGANTDGIYLTQLGAALAMRNPATETGGTDG